MCGICGICMRGASRPVDLDRLRRMTALLAHRGPDGEGFLRQGAVGFGHRRLSIIDIEEGAQPIFNEDESIGIVFNGEIYNYVELMEDLKGRGHRFRTHSDTEVIVHLYEELGDACVEALRGMFAFAIWDGRDGSVLLARDRLGIKPLFFSVDDASLVFASEMKAIVETAQSRPPLQVDVLREYLTYGYVPGDRCIVSGIEKLPPGHILRWRHGQMTTTSYWDVSLEANGRHGSTDFRGALDDALHEAVRIHLRADVPVGVLLSGGVDSSAVVALASRALEHPLQTFSIGFAEADFNELEAARITAERYRTEHHELVVRDHDLDILPEVVRHLDEPFADPSALATYYVCREAARHVKVCLSGDGADELFAGYHRYRQFQDYARFDAVPLAVRRGLRAGLGRVWPRWLSGRGALDRMGSNGAERYLGTIGIFSGDEIANLLAIAPASGMWSPTRCFEPYFDANGGGVTTLQHVDQKTYLPDDILVKVDRMAMQNSLEVRPPFLDHAVVECANRCPEHLKFRGGAGKVLLKEILADRVPGTLLQRRKMGFGLPIKHWFRGNMNGYAGDLLLSSQARSAAYFARPAVERLLADHARGGRDLSRRIWALIVFEWWCRAYGY